MNRRAVRVIVVALVVIAALLSIRLLPVGEWLARFQTYVRGAGAIGYVAYAAVYALCVVFLVPATILTIGAGAIFGVVTGTIVVVAGATAGATLAFLLARTLLRKRVEAMTHDNPKFRALDRAIASEGTKIVLLVRLSPLFPFTWVNYAFGLTGIATLPYIVTTLLGIVPGSLAFVYLSDAAVSAARGQMHTAQIAIRIAGAVIALAASLFVARVATKAIRRAGVD